MMRGKIARIIAVVMFFAGIPLNFFIARFVFSNVIIFEIIRWPVTIILQYFIFMLAAYSIESLFVLFIFYVIYNKLYPESNDDWVEWD